VRAPVPMATATRDPRIARERVGRDPGPFGSLLVPVDLSPVSDRVVGRVALLPVAERAAVTLLHVVAEGLPPRARRLAEGDARKALAAEARSLARSLPEGVAIRPVVTVGAPAAGIAACADSVEAEMIVMGRGGRRTFRDLFLGSTAERVVRRARLPVLVVRLPPRAPYRRPALALERDRAAHEAVAWLLRVIRPPRPRVAVIHAYDAPFHGIIYPSLSADEAEEYRETHRQDALRALATLLETALRRAGVRDHAPSWKMHVRYGDPRTVIEKAVERADADLVALGTRGYSGVAHALLGTVAGDVLRHVACDVLVVPPPPERPAA
jgi:nucleotide-binding universal stress UspA family protein